MFIIDLVLCVLKGGLVLLGIIGILALRTNPRLPPVGSTFEVYGFFTGLAVALLGIPGNIGLLCKQRWGMLLASGAAFSAFAGFVLAFLHVAMSNHGSDRGAVWAVFGVMAIVQFAILALFVIALVTFDRWQSARGSTQISGQGYAILSGTLLFTALVWAGLGYLVLGTSSPSVAETRKPTPQERAEAKRAVSQPIEAPPEGKLEKLADDTITMGGGFDPLVRDVAPSGGMLVGFEVGLGKFFDSDVVRAVRPIFRTRGAETLGEQYGNELDRVVVVKAKEGYAVGAITVKAGLTADGFLVTYMRVINDKQLDPADNYESIWIGGFGGGGPMELSGGGRPAIGIIARQNQDNKNCTGIGLAFLPVSRGVIPDPRQVTVDQSKKPADAGVTRRAEPKPTNVAKMAEPPKPPPSVNDTIIMGGGGNSTFRDVAPAGGLLVGFEVGLGKFLDDDVVHAVRPIFRKDGEESLGEQHGNELDRVVVVKAKEGYAVGAVTFISSFMANGFLATYMRVIDNEHLDPNDTYESIWIGGFGAGMTRELSGGGRPTIGIIGKRDDAKKICTGIGLTFLPQPGGTVPDPLEVTVDKSKKPRDAGITRRAPPKPGELLPDESRMAGQRIVANYYRDVAPEGGLLVGLEIGLRKSVKGETTQAFKPIFRIDKRESVGLQHGLGTGLPKRVVARAGYAVGALKIQQFGSVDGVSLVFMRIDGDKLDPNDSYESPWVGNKPGGAPTILTGEGIPIIGIIGTAKGTENTGLGIVGAKPLGYN